jgi:hypothetical protein
MGELIGASVQVPIAQHPKACDKRHCIWLACGLLFYKLLNAALQRRPLRVSFPFSQLSTVMPLLKYLRLLPG